MQLELKRMQRDVGIAFVVVTHDQEEALVMSDRAAVLDRGRVVQVGTPADLYERPLTRFAAQFLGQMNLIEGRVAGDALAVEGIGTLSGTPAPGVGEGPGCLAVRPERVALAAEGDGLPATVTEVVYHGAGQTVHLRLANGTPLRADRRAADIDRMPLEAGQRIIARLDAVHCRLLAGSSPLPITIA
jgi:ABC-type Fe3+/spermidine/putrescine transport system ATPase subunit